MAVDFGLGASSDKLREEVRSFLEDTITREFEEQVYRSGVAHDPTFAAALVERGWLAADWPEERGGPAMPTWDRVALAEELQHFDAPVYATTTTEMVGKTIAEMGSPDL